MASASKVAVRILEDWQALRRQKATMAKMLKHDFFIVIVLVEQHLLLKVREEDVKAESLLPGILLTTCYLT